MIWDEIDKLLQLEIFDGIKAFVGEKYDLTNPQKDPVIQKKANFYTMVLIDDRLEKIQNMINNYQRMEERLHSKMRFLRELDINSIEYLPSSGNNLIKSTILTETLTNSHSRTLGTLATGIEVHYKKLIDIKSNFSEFYDSDDFKNALQEFKDRGNTNLRENDHLAQNFDVED